MSTMQSNRYANILVCLTLACCLGATSSCKVQGRPFVDYSGALQNDSQPDNKPDNVNGWTMQMLDTKLKVNPRDASSLILRGRLHQIRDEREAAIADFDKGIAISPDRGEYYLYRCETYVLMARYDKAMADVNKAAAMLPHSAPVYARRARLEAVMENYDGAIADVKKSLLYDAHGISAISVLAQSYDALGKYAAALGVADFGLDSDAQNRPDSLYYAYQDRALILIHAAQYDAARKDLEAGIALNPRHSQLYAYLALLEAMRGRQDEAEKAMDTTMKLDTFAPRANRLKGEMYRAAGLWKKAIESYDRSTGMEPEYGPGFSQRAIAEIARGLYPLAERDLQTAAKLVPTSALAYSYLSVALAAQGDDAGAQKALKRAFQITPDLPINYVNRATVSFIAGDLSSALADCQQAIKLCPYQADAYALVAAVLKRASRADEAKAFDDRARLLGWKEPEQAIAGPGVVKTGALPLPALPPLAVLKAQPFSMVDPDAAP
jgi:tetratricopeptide (TPR) repeat protein